MMRRISSTLTSTAAIAQEFALVFSFFPVAATGYTIGQLVVGLVPVTELYLTAKIIDLLASSANTIDATALFEYTLPYLTALLAVFIVQRIAFTTNDYLEVYIREHLVASINDRIHQKILSLDAAVLERAEVQTHITFLKENSWRPYQIFYTALTTFGNAASLVSFIIVAVQFSTTLTVIFGLAVLPGLVISIRALRRSYELEWGKAAVRRRLWYFESLFRTHAEIVPLIIHGIGSFFAKKYSCVAQEIVDRELRIARVRMLGSIVTHTLVLSAYAWAFIRIFFAASARTISLGQFTLYIGAFLNVERFMVTQAWHLSNLTEHAKYLSAFRKLESLPSIDDVGAETLRGPISISFESVSFSYPQASSESLHNVTFNIPTGSCVALVGENGAGKTTIVKLLLRLYEPTGGAILINGKDYRSYTRASLRAVVAVMFQDVARYALTVKESITTSETPKTTTIHGVDDTIVHAARAAGAHEKIMELEQQYATMLRREYDDAGVELSGGEWQKIALARTLMKNADVLILDEPTAALDARSEYEFFSKLFAREQRQSLLLISHRFSSVRFADKIVVLQHGRVVESGTHAELVRRPRGHYAQLYRMQTKEIKKKASKSGA